MSFDRQSVLARINQGPVRYCDLAGPRAKKDRSQLHPLLKMLEAEGTVKAIRIDGLAHYARADWKPSDEEVLALIEGKSRRKMDGSGCLEWSGYVDPRRGPIVWLASESTNIPARRVVWGIKRGTLAYQDAVRVRCENDACVEFKHMVKGRREDLAKGRAITSLQRSRIAQVHRARGKLDWDKVRAIRASSESLAVLAERYKVRKCTISQVRRNESWRELGGMFTSLLVGRKRK